MRKSQRDRRLEILLLTLAGLLLISACGTDPAPTVQPETTPTAVPATPDTGTSPDEAPAPEPARDMEEYFAGRTIAVYVGSNPGGGYDVAARLFALYAPQYFPGRPRIIVTNLPGGGGLRAILRTEEDTSGRSVVTASPRFLMQWALGEDPGFNIEGAHYLGTPTVLSDDPQYFCVRREVASSWEEVLALGRDITGGISSRGSQNSQGIELVEIVGGPIRVVAGYTGTADFMAAVDRGELDGAPVCRRGDIERLYPEWLDNRTVVPVFSWAAPPDAEWMADLGVPVPPDVLDIVDLTSEQESAFIAATTMHHFSRTYLLPAGVPEDVVQVWLDVTRQVFNDPAFREAAIVAGIAGAEGGYAPPDDIFGVLELVHGLGPEGMELFRQLVSE